MSLFLHISRPLTSRPHTRNNSRRHTQSAPPAVEALEVRTLLAGLDISQSVFDTTLFAQNLEEQVPVDATGLNGVVGYSYAIIDGDPDDPVAGAGGFAVMPWDNPSGFFPIAANSNRPQEIASPSKLISGAVIMHLLQEQNPGLNYDDLQDALQTELNQPIVNYLPAPWAAAGWAPSFAGIQVGELLTHSSGLRNNANPGGWVTTSTLPGPPLGSFTGGGNIYNYSGLQQISQFGSVDPSKPTEYWTNNFAWFRVMLPYMWDEINNAALDANALNGILLDTEALTSNEALRDDLTDAMMEDWGASFFLGTNSLVITPDQVVASIYKYYVSTNLLEPAGVDDPQTQTTGLTPTLMYPLAPTIVPGTDVWPIVMGGSPTPALTPGVDTGDQSLNVGSRGWNLSAEDLARAFWAVRNGATDGTPIFEDATLDMMDAQGLGWQHSTNSGFVGDFGQYYGHNGVNFRPSAPTAITIPSPNVPNNARLGNMNNTAAIAFLNGVSASLLINSQIQSEDSAVGTPVVIGAAFNPTATPTGTGTNASLIAAYDNAWTELVYDGDGIFDPNPNDSFTIRQNSMNPAWIDIVHVGAVTTTVTRRIDTLSRITLNGFGGDNSFDIQFLPENIELVIYGGFVGNDSIIIGDGDIDTNIQGVVSINAQFDGGDSLTIDDTSDTGNDHYFFDGNEFTKWNFVGELNFTGIQFVTLSTNPDNNQVHVLRTPLGTTSLTVDLTANGNNTVFAGNGDFDTNILSGLTVNGGSGFDRFVILDNLDDSGNDQYVFDGPADVSSNATFDKTSYNGVASYDSSVNSIELEASDFDNTVFLNGTNVGTAVTLNMNAGDDVIHVGSGVLEDLTEVTVDAGTGIDLIILHDETDTGDDTYTVGNDFADKTGFSLEYSNAEQLTLNANPDRNRIDVESVLATTPVTIDGRGGSDTIHIAPTAQDLSVIHALVSVNGGEGTDNVILHDVLSNPLDPLPFAITHDTVTRPIPPFIVPRFELRYREMEQLALELGAAADLVDIQSTAPGMHVVVESGFGNDTVQANVPTPARLTIDGGPDTDTVELLGTPADDELSVSAGFGSADVNLISFEDASIDLAGGADVLVLEGVAGVDEQVEVQSTTTAHQGTLSVVGSLDLAFENAEIIDLVANPGEMDTAAFIGTDLDDQFEIYVGAAGTNVDPVLQLFEPDGVAPLLTLRDYTNFSTLLVRGEDGADLFNVYALPAGPGTGRNLSVDGGAPSGSGNPKAKDKLNVYRELGSPPPPPTPNPGGPNDFGTINVDYEDYLFSIDYSDIEQKKVLPINAAG